MVTIIELVQVTNAIAGIFVILPILLNFKYYLQFRMVDYAFVSGFFFLGFLGNFGLALFKTGSSIVDIITGTYFFSLFENALMFYVLARLRFTKIPTLANLYVGSNIIIALSLLIDRLILGETRIIGNHFLSQWFYSPSCVILGFFMVYSVLTTSVSVNNNRVRGSRLMWAISGALWGSGQVLLTAAVVLDIDIFSESLWLFTSVLVLVTIATLFLLLNHIFFPEAVLISYAQLHRAINVYNALDYDIGEHNSLENLGASTIVNYLESAKGILSEEA